MITLDDVLKVGKPYIPGEQLKVLTRLFTERDEALAHLSFMRKENISAWNLVEELTGALEKAQSSLATYRRHVSEPFTENLVSILGSREAEKASVEALAKVPREFRYKA